ncbi:2,4'-dihydroxyacetophenone dioxygenase family protein [Photobacterium halotolerans]|uniref:2,4-dihydroxyacetophenone dioxygenase n=1 Tax=Photobacterium halotolerans TaxID=265726 RepID=A0A0F5VB16_9GAMM|nr:2,4'-dihydroxyacetophenone dioxygenase family protein [Photobacterium halotolerans]KKC99313.1 2,4-dihydroxyacetophenone dioxygenase [Photobacterium halotolerans]
MGLPFLVNKHHELMTLNNNELPIYRDALPDIPGVHVQPQFLDPDNGVWVLRVLFEPGVVLPMHYHTGSVHLWTLSGCWHYAEYPDQPQTAGCYLYEPGSSIHQFLTPADNTEVTDTLMVVTGSNINFDKDGNYLGMLDANSIIAVIEHLIRERGLEPATYIRPEPAKYTTK